MKKLIVAAVAIALAVVANANTVTWGIAAGQAIDSTIFKSGTAYLVDASLLSKPSLTSDSDAATWYNNNGSSVAGAALRTATVTDGAVNNTEVIQDLSGRKNYWMYVINDKADHISVSTITKAITWSAGTTSSTATWTSTQMKTFAIPEPTSALLLLLGVAGLALRRKQK